MNLFLFRCLGETEFNFLINSGSEKDAWLELMNMMRPDSHGHEDPITISSLKEDGWEAHKLENITKNITTLGYFRAVEYSE